jgi:hypothetical protein
METISYPLHGVVPHSEINRVEFTRIEVLKHESSPLAVVWYRVGEEPREKGARIDLQKQAFLDDIGDTDRTELSAQAHLIVAHFFVANAGAHAGGATFFEGGAS